MPELVWKFRNLDLCKISEDGNGAADVLDRLDGDGVAFEVYGALTNNVIAGSWSVEREACHPTSGAAHDEGRVSARVLDGAADDGSGVGVGGLEVSVGEAARAVD